MYAMDTLKTLAVDLGLVETFFVKSVGTGTRSAVGSAELKVEQPFDYLIIIDFESTCWDSSSTRNQNWQHLPEIIEFPAVLLNLSTGEIEEEFHQYVMPFENPKLSDFCVKLTGIKQEQVDAGVPLPSCLSLFSRWVTKISKSERKLSFHKRIPLHKACTFVTWSDWDLGVCLHNETQRKQIRKPDTLSQWIDLKALYKVFYNRQPHGLRGALAELGIAFEGREHSGIVDAKNTASLALRMVKDGCQLKLTRSASLQMAPVKARNNSLATIKGFIRKPLKTVNELVARPTSAVKMKSPMERDSSPVISSRLRSLQKKAIDANTPISRYKHQDSLKKRCDESALTVLKVRHGKTDTSLVKEMKTPETSKQRLAPPSTRRTPPLCQCGRRAVCKVVNSPGPNQGRSFFSCSRHRRSLGIKNRIGCNFFMWCGKDM